MIKQSFRFQLQNFTKPNALAAVLAEGGIIHFFAPLLLSLAHHAEGLLYLFDDDGQKFGFTLFFFVLLSRLKSEKQT